MLGSRSLDCCDYKTGCLYGGAGCGVSTNPAAITLNKLECSKQASYTAENNLAWNNGI